MKLSLRFDALDSWWLIFTHGKDGARGGVYFEAGLAYGLGLPVIYTCRKDKVFKLHFDTRQYHHIVWEEPADLCRDLKNRIQALIGEGPKKRHPLHLERGKTA